MDPMQGMMGAGPGQPMQPPMPMGGGEAPMDPQQAGMMSEMEGPVPGAELGAFSEPEEDNLKWLDFALQQANLAKSIKKKKGGEDILNKIGERVVKGYQDDETSREDWMKNNKEWMELSLLVRKGKTFPWPGASNVKYPLISTAAMQFSARAFPSLVPADGRIVKTKINAKNQNGKIYQSASRVANHMSFQLKHRLPRWEEDMDKLLMTLAVSGLCFKKTYWSGVEQAPRSYLVYPEHLCVNYFAKDLDSAYRKTELMFYTKNEVREKVLNDEEFLDVLDDIEAGTVDEKKTPVANKLVQPSADDSTPHVFLQQHTFYDLDEDGYEEPYVITVHKDTKKVVQILARWDRDGVTRNEDGDIIRIKPVEYYTDFQFIPNPDGSIYGLGFGTLLGPLNISINTLINQLIDSGTINNLQSGFIGKGLRIKMGEASMKPGEWRVVNATGDDLSKSVFPLPTKEPSGVLFNLMNMLIQSGNQLASIAEIFVGKMPGQNTPATTTQETVQQSMAVFTAIYKRVYRSLDMEFKKLYRLNGLNPATLEEEVSLAGIALEKSDYDFPDWIIVPGADPTGDSSMIKSQKLQQVGQLLQFGFINVGKFTELMLQELEIPDVEQLMQQPQPQPDPKAQQMQMQMQMEQMKAQLEAQAMQQEMEFKKQMNELDAQIKILTLQIKEREASIKQRAVEGKTQLDLVDKVEKNKADAQMRDAQMLRTSLEHAQKMSHNEQQFRQKQAQAAQAGRSKSK